MNGLRSWGVYQQVMLVYAVLTAVGLAAVTIGIWMLRRAIRSSTRKWTGIAVIVVGAVVAVPGMAILDLGPPLEEQMRAFVCVTWLSELKSSIEEFKEQKGRYPKDIDELVSGLDMNRKLVRCPSSGAEYGYIRPSDTTTRTDVLCFDSEAHIERHGILRFLKRRYFIVVLFEGSVSRRLTKPHVSGGHQPE